MKKCSGALGKEIGKRIRHIRKLGLGLTQEEFRKIIRVPKQNYVSRFEMGRIPSHKVLIRIANAGNVSLDWLLTGVEFQDRQKQSAA